MLLLQMIETGDGAAAFYSDVMQAVSIWLSPPPPGRRPMRPVSWTGSTWPGWNRPTGMAPTSRQ